MFENFTDTFIGLGRALQIAVCVDNFLNGITLLNWLVNFLSGSDWCRTYFSLSDGLLGGFCELLDGLLVISKILLATDENNRKALAEVKNLRNPLLKIKCEISIIFATLTNKSGF